MPTDEPTHAVKPSDAEAMTDLEQRIASAVKTACDLYRTREPTHQVSLRYFSACERPEDPSPRRGGRGREWDFRCHACRIDCVAFFRHRGEAFTFGYDIFHGDEIPLAIEALADAIRTEALEVAPLPLAEVCR